MLIVLFCSGSIPIPSRHTTRVPLRSVVTVTVAVDVMDVPVLTSVTVNWNWASGNTLPWSRGRRDREMFKNGMSHWCPLEGIVHVNVTLSLGHGLSTLDCNWAPETENEQCCSYISLKTQHTNFSFPHRRPNFSQMPWPCQKTRSEYIYLENWGLITNHISMLLHDSDCSCREVMYIIANG